MAMELVELLLIAAVGTALAAVVLAGLMWTPWLILASLLVLLWVLLKLPIARSTVAVPIGTDPMVDPPSGSDSSRPTSESQISSDAIASHSIEPRLIESLEPLTYRGASYMHHRDTPVERDGDAVEQVRIYRGTVYKISVPSQ